jgi:hypothetical protein
MLYVDEDNVPAIRMYEALGFTRTRVDAMYRQPAVLARGDDPPEPPAAPSGGTHPPRPPLGGTHPPGPPLAGLVAVYPQRFVEFRGCQRPVRRRHRAQHLGVELYFIKGDAIVDTKIQLPGNRAHLRR